ncbi:sulfate transporter-like [Littorina saxatilis]|uniref:STAS domain-containing protein n=1 Tax=Littorina saxatilis TaxID=31220 RepID=A0AAN9BML2_9CAEN
MSKKVTDLRAEAQGEEQAASPLLPLSQSKFTSSSMGSMELVGIRERKPMKVLEFESQYRQPDEKYSVLEIVKERIVKKCSKFSCKRMLVSNFPILSALNKYKVLRDLPSDVIAGLTAGIMMIPQGLAFAYLSTLDPIIGLYISLFSSLTYFLLGTGQQVSFGCIAILSIMMGSILDKYEIRLRQSAGVESCGTFLTTTTLPSPLVNGTTSFSTAVTTSENTSFSSPGVDWSNTTASPLDFLDPAIIQEKKLQLAGGVTLLCGIIFVILGKIGLGKVTVFMSDSMVTGVTVGAAFHVGSSQLKTIFGLSFLPRESGVFKLLKLWYSILKNIHHSNLASIIAAVICILIIYLVKRFINEKYKDKLRAPVPIELIVMMLATVITYYASLHDKFNISIVKNVPVGVPTPRIPDMSLGVEYLGDGLVIIIVAFAQTVSVAKLMGMKHNYAVDSSQEMYAVGMVNIVCAIFSGYISGASVSRSMVQDGAGGKTQIASLFAAALVLLVMLFIGPYFYYVPKIALSAIIIVSLRSLMLKLLTIPEMWRKSKVDCMVFVITVAASVILDADLGLLVGVGVSVLLILFQAMRSSVDMTTHIALGEQGVWKSKDKYYGGEDVAGVKVVRINSPLYFFNAEITTNAIFRKTNLNPLKVKKECFESEVKPDKSEAASKADAGSKDVGKDKIIIDTLPPNHGRHNGDLTAVDAEKGDAQNGNGSAVDEAKGHTNSTHEVPQLASSNAPVQAPIREVPFSTLILDLSGVSFVDLMGVKALEFLIVKYGSVGVDVLVTNVCENCLDTLKKCGFMAKQGDRVFLTNETAFAFKQFPETLQITENTKL